MTSGSRGRLAGLRSLIFDGVETVTSLVQRTHAESSHRWERVVGSAAATILGADERTDAGRSASSAAPEAAAASLAEQARRSLALVGPLARGVNRLQLSSSAVTYASIRLANRSLEKVVGWGTDGLLAGASDGPPTPLRSDSAGTLGWWLDHAEGALNGVFGDHLSARGNALDVGMTLRHEGQVVALDDLASCYPDATGKICIFVHGLSSTEWSWVMSSERIWGDASVGFGSKLRDELGYTPLYLRYNSGRHISTNGRALCELLEAVVAAYPHPIEEIVLVGHSMGGLVARSAAHYGGAEATRWSALLRHVFCIGSPHLGAPLEQGTNRVSSILRAIPAAGARVPAAVLDARSAGIKDLRYGYTVDEEWDGLDAGALDDRRLSIPLVDGVGYYFVAGTITTDPEHPLGQLVGDLLVRAPSASGQAPEPARCVRFRFGQVFGGLGHIALANDPAVYEMLRRCLTASLSGAG